VVYPDLKLPAGRTEVLFLLVVALMLSTGI
jgi:hypothetical protein